MRIQRPPPRAVICPCRVWRAGSCYTLCIAAYCVILLIRQRQFVHYNTVLRRWPVNIYESLNGNTYATTIHCLVSGVTKVSRRTKIPSGLVLYRGFGGLKLPDQFYKAPEGGFKGFVEWGFMVSPATLAARDTACHDGNECCSVLLVLHSHGEVIVL
jgi:hypothetical protein